MHDHPAPSQPSVHAHVQPVRPPAPVQVRVQTGGFGRSILAAMVGCLLVAFLLMGGFFFGAVSAGIAGALGDPTGGRAMVETVRSGSNDHIAILPVEGVIDETRAAFVRDAVDGLLEDRRLRAVVLRVNSPGGGVTASDQIWYEVGRLRARGVPVIASFGGVAASGGYYAACASDEIFAERTTITGSIGVIAQVLTLGDMLEKIGVEPVTLVADGSPDKATGNDIMRRWTDDDRAQLGVILNDAYDVFAERVRDGRGERLTAEGSDRAVTGSVFTGPRAMELGLVDAIGYLDDALARAESVAGLVPGRATIIRAGERPMLFGAFPLARRSTGDTAAEIRRAADDLLRPRVLYLMH